MQYKFKLDITVIKLNLLTFEYICLNLTDKCRFLPQLFGNNIKTLMTNLRICINLLSNWL